METDDAINALAALAQSSRLEVFRKLVQAGPEGVAAGRLGEILGIPPATLSFHLKELKAAGLVCCEQRGRSRLYSPDCARVAELVAYLTANCCRGLDETNPSPACSC